MSLADSDFEAVGFDSAFEEASGEQSVAPVLPSKVYRKQEFNIYSFLLILSFLMLLVSIVLLFLEVGRYE
jgi:hypothetical protein